MEDSYHQDLCTRAKSDTSSDQHPKRESSLEVSHREADSVWDPEHKKATIRIFRKEMKGRLRHQKGESTQSSLDASQWEADSVWDPEHKKATIRIFRKERRGRLRHCSKELRQTIIEGIKNAKNINNYITFPPELNQKFR